MHICCILSRYKYQLLCILDAGDYSIFFNLLVLFAMPSSINQSFASSMNQSVMDMFDCPTLESLQSLRQSAASQRVETTASGAVLRTYGLDGSSLSPASGMSSGEDMIFFSPPHSPAMVPGVGQMDMNPLDLQVARHVPRPIARHDEHHHGQDAEEVSSVSSSIDTEDYGGGPGSSP